MAMGLTLTSFNGGYMGIKVGGHLANNGSGVTLPITSSQVIAKYTGDFYIAYRLTYGFDADDNFENLYVEVWVGDALTAMTKLAFTMGWGGESAISNDRKR